MSITCSAFMASMTDPGPTGIPAARNARAKPTTLSAIRPVGGLRWSMAMGISIHSSFRDTPQGAGPESILTMVVMDSGFDASHRPGMTQASILAGRFLQNLLQALALHARDVVLVLQQRTEGVADDLRSQRAGVELG